MWQVHAHSHEHATKVVLRRTRGGRTETLFELAPYCGYVTCPEPLCRIAASCVGCRYRYGACQHFHDLPGAPTLQAGDSLEFVCTCVTRLNRAPPCRVVASCAGRRCRYDNADAHTLAYGISRGNEMCGPLVIYTPHEAARGMAGTWYQSTDGLMRLPGATEWTRPTLGPGSILDQPTNLGSFGFG